MGSSWHQTHLGARETLQFAGERLIREGIELLDAHDVDIVDPALLALFEQVVIDLAAAQHDALDLLVDELGVVVPEQAVEGRVRARISLSFETASLWRSSDFGVIRMSGLRKLRCSCRRSAWK